MERKLHEATELLKVERECVRRNEDHICDRDCSNCDIVQDTSDLLWMYDYVINILEKMQDISA